MSKLSVHLNHLTCGPRGYSLCARAWAGRLAGKLLHTYIVWALDRLFWYDRHHCYKAFVKRSSK
jgi:hypothetical protein